MSQRFCCFCGCARVFIGGEKEALEILEGELTNSDVFLAEAISRLFSFQKTEQTLN